MKKGKKTSLHEQEYWQSIADMLTALLLVALLLVLILILYIVQIRDVDYTDYHDDINPGVIYDHAWGYDDPDKDNDRDNDRDNDYPYDWPDHSAGGGGGYGGGDDGDGDGDGDGTGDYEFPEVGINEEEGFGRAAVYVMVVDAETDRTIKEENIVFELYSARDELKVLNTYYPNKIEFRSFATTESGVFYLPEKVDFGTYYLHELTAPSGYDIADNQSFDLDLPYDWNEPYVVKVPMYPSRNVIRIQVTDADSGSGVAGGVYDVIAINDIITDDGTLRYTAGQVVEQITVDETGYGESSDLFLGTYRLKQSTIPEFYAADLKTLDVKVEKRTENVQPQIHDISCRKTAVTVTLTDELYPNIVLPNVGFSLRTADETDIRVTAKTDVVGRIRLSELKKNATYYLHQVDTREGYRLTSQDVSFYVDANGYIQNAPQMELQLTNRILRVSIGVTDMLVRNQVSDYNVAMFNANDELIQVWDTNGIAKTIEGIEEGTYYLYINGSSNAAMQFDVLDEKELQYFHVNVWTNVDIAVILAAIAIAAGSIAIIVVALTRRHRKKKEVRDS